MVQIDPRRLANEVARMLFESWVVRLAGERLALTQYGSGESESGRTASFGSPTGPHFVLSGGAEIEVIEIAGLDATEVEDVVAEAIDRVAAHDFGDGVVYRLTLTVEAVDTRSSGSLHLMRVLGDQVHIEGSRRLSDAALLDFPERFLDVAPERGLLFAPTSEVTATIFAPGPCPGYLSQRAAAAISETVAAVCAIATGRTVKFSVPQFPLDEADAGSARALRHDSSIPGLARESISLDVFGELQAVGGPEAAIRVRGALLAYHAAMWQTNPDVAVMLFVSAIEALLSPWAEWGKLKVTQRFIKAVIELCPDAVDALLGHGNVEYAFGFDRRGGLGRQRRELLDLIYEARSIPTHRGLGLSGSGLLDLSSAGHIRVALLSDLARAAILAFIQAPRSSIIGYLDADPGVRDPHETR